VAHSHGTKSGKAGQLGTSPESAGEIGVPGVDEKGSLREKDKEKKKVKKSKSAGSGDVSHALESKSKENEEAVELKKEKRKDKGKKKKEGKLTDASGDELDRDVKGDERREKKKEKKGKDKDKPLPDGTAGAVEKSRSVGLISGILHKSASSKRDSKIVDASLSHDSKNGSSAFNVDVSPASPPTEPAAASDQTESNAALLAPELSLPGSAPSLSPRCCHRPVWIPP
jgi:hypothetical protein